MDNFRAQTARLYIYLSKINLAHVLVLGLVVKATINDISYPSFLLTVPVLGYEAYKLYIRSKTPNPIELDVELRKELDNIKSKLNAQTLEKGLKAPVARYF